MRHRSHPLSTRISRFISSHRTSAGDSERHFVRGWWGSSVAYHTWRNAAVTVLQGDPLGVFSAQAAVGPVWKNKGRERFIYLTRRLFLQVGLSCLPAVPGAKGHPGVPLHPAAEHPGVTRRQPR